MKALFRIFWAVSLVGLLLPACATTEDEAIQPSIDDDSNPDQMGYPEDPELAGTEPDPLPTGEPEDMPGPLTDEPFPSSDSQPGYESGDDIEGGADDSVDQAGQDYADSFDDPEPYDSSLDDAGLDDSTEPIDAEVAMPDANYNNSDANFGDGDGDGDGSQALWVDALQLNVRRGPDFSSEIVRRVRGGDKLMVTIEGRFAKIRSGEYVSRKYLSTNPTRRVSPTEIKQAWQKSRYKDTWDGK